MVLPSAPAGAGHVFCVSRLFSLRFEKGIGITRRENGHILISEAYPFSENGRILTDLGLGNREYEHILNFLGLGCPKYRHILPS
jgi:hypothetical protein